MTLTVRHVIILDEIYSGEIPFPYSKMSQGAGMLEHERIKYLVNGSGASLITRHLILNAPID